MPLIDELAPAFGPLLGFALGQPIRDATKQYALDWLPFRVGGQTLGENAAWKHEPPFEASIVLQGRDGSLQAVEVIVQVERPSKSSLDALEKELKKRLRARLGPFSKDKLRDPRPHWFEPSSPPALWMILRWMNSETAGLKVVMQRA